METSCELTMATMQNAALEPDAAFFRRTLRHMKFGLLFLPKRKSPWGGACAYIYVSEWGGYGEDDRDPRYGHHMLTSESMSENECHGQIDRLINDLKKLKATASRKFGNQG